MGELSVTGSGTEIISLYDLPWSKLL